MEGEQDVHEGGGVVVGQEAVLVEDGLQEGSNSGPEEVAAAGEGEEGEEVEEGEVISPAGGGAQEGEALAD